MISFGEMFSGIAGFRYGLERCNFGLEKAENRWSSESFRKDSGTRRDLLDSSRTEDEHSSSYSCVWANDFDKYACQIYRKHYGNKELVEGDIRQVDPKTVPDFDLLTAGFPCQSFSLAGKRKGFQDIRGTLFYEVVRVASAKRPKLLLLENVKGLLSNDNGKTFGTILEELGNIGYWVEWQTLNSKHFGVPQNRERVFIVGHLRTEPTKQIFPVGEAGEGFDEPCTETEGEGIRVRNVHSLGNIYPSGGEAGNIIDANGIFPTLKQGKRGGKAGIPPIAIANSLNCSGSGKERNLIESALIQSQGREPHIETRKDGVSHALKGKGGWEGNYLQIANTISHRYGKDGSENLSLNPSLNADGTVTAIDASYYKGHGTRGNKMRALATEGQRIRRLTPTECERLQGFPDGWTEGVSDTQRYKLLGNAVTTNVISFLGEKLLEVQT